MVVLMLMGLMVMGDAESDDVVMLMDGDADDTDGDDADDANGDVVDCIFEFSTSLPVSSDCLVVCGSVFTLLCGSDVSLTLIKCFALCLCSTVCEKTGEFFFFFLNRDLEQSFTREEVFADPS